jgi:hypothetical protein
MMQTDVLSKFVTANIAVTDARSRIKGMWVSPTVATNPNPTFVNTATSLTGTYSQTTTTITVTCTAHGLVVGQRVSLAFTSGSGASGGFAIATVADANTFTVTTPLTGTNSGNVTIYTQVLIELGISALTQGILLIPGEGVLSPNGIFYVGITEITVFYG